MMLIVQVLIFLLLICWINKDFVYIIQISILHFVICWIKNEFVSIFQISILHLVNCWIKNNFLLIVQVLIFRLVICRIKNDCLVVQVLILYLIICLINNNSVLIVQVFNISFCNFLNQQGFCLSFLTQLDRSSHPVVESLIRDHILGHVNASSILCQPLPHPPYTGKWQMFEGFWVELGEKEPFIPQDYVLTKSIKANLKDLTRVVAGRWDLKGCFLKILYQSIQFWSGFIPVNRGGRIYPALHLSNSHSPSRSIHGILLLQTNTLALLLQFIIVYVKEVSSSLSFLLFSCICNKRTSKSVARNIIRS